MLVNRRKFLQAATMAAATSGAVTPAAAAVVRRNVIRAIAFDGFPIFDPRPIFALAEQLFPGRGAELSDLWRTRQFEYTWLRTVARLVCPNGRWCRSDLRGKLAWRSGAEDRYGA
jgi:2-haloacid dehalogenase